MKPLPLMDCAWKTGSTQPDGSKAPPELCKKQGCDGKAHNSIERPCYYPYLPLEEEKQGEMATTEVK